MEKHPWDEKEAFNYEFTYMKTFVEHSIYLNLNFFVHQQTLLF